MQTLLNNLPKGTADRAKEDNIRGWCMYTSLGTFKGHIEGDRGFIERMQNWIETLKPKLGTVQKVLFFRSCPIKQFSLEEFKIRKKDQYY